jgi:hypothetical protein
MYYPSSEIELVSYTSGLDFEVKTTRKPYIGYYYATNDRKFFSGKRYDSTTVELIPLLRNLFFNDNIQAYNFYYSEPTDSSYDKGFFERYVLKRVNGDLQTIMEVSKEEFNRAVKDPLYVAKSFTWKLTGPLYTTSEGVPGIVNTNQKTLDELEKSIPEVKKYFTNLAQYAK